MKCHVDDSHYDLPVEPDHGFVRQDGSWYGSYTCPACGQRRLAPASRWGPGLEALREMGDDGVVEALDGCQVEPDGTCEHGMPSWLIAVGVI